MGLLKHTAIPLTLILSSSLSWGIEFNGYFRAGVNTTNKGGSVDYRVNDLGRYGNENTGWYTLFLGDEIFNKDNHSVNVVTGLEGNTGLTKAFEPNGLPQNQGNLRAQDRSYNSFTNLYAEFIGFLPFAPEAHLWVGKRNYDKKELQFMDYKIVAIGGPGVGVDHIKVGNGKLALSWVRSDSSLSKAISPSTASTTNDGLDVNVLDARYSFPIFDRSKLEWIADYGIPTTTTSQDTNVSRGLSHSVDNPLMLTGIFTTPFLNGFNETNLQFATKGWAANMTGLGIDLNTDSDFSEATGYRLINTGEFYPSSHVIIAHAFTYAQAYKLSNPASRALDLRQGNSAHEQDQRLVSFAIRPGYIWDQYNKTTFEASVFKRENDNKTLTGSKFTVAQVISVGESMLTVRPEVRFYATYLKANDEKPFNDGQSDSQFTIGAQAEAWW